MRNWILKSHCLEFLTCSFTVLYFCFINSVCFCDIAVFAVCTCKMKVREIIYFYTAFMQMLSIGAKLTVRHIGRQMKPENAAKMIFDVTDVLGSLTFEVGRFFFCVCVYYVLFNIQKGQCMHVHLICIFEKSNFL